MKLLNQLLKKHKTLVFLDFEGTQFSHEIIAIGAIKCKIDSKGNIIEEKENGFKTYVKATNPIGHIITDLTHITDEKLKEEGKSVEDALNEFASYIGDDINDSSFIVFGSNDAQMLLMTRKLSRPKNEDIVWKIMNNIVDFHSFISQFCRDSNSNTYSLVNYLKHFKGIPQKESHDPLNDAIDLKNLYKQVLKNNEILCEDYKDILKKQKTFPYPIKKILHDIYNGKTISEKELNEYIKEYLS